jgi:Rnl2 family RNA ligase
MHSSHRSRGSTPSAHVHEEFDASVSRVGTELHGPIRLRLGKMKALVARPRCGCGDSSDVGPHATYHNTMAATGLQLWSEAAGRCPFERHPFQKIATTSAQYASTPGASSSPVTPPPSHIAPAKPNTWYVTEKIHGAQLQLYIQTAPDAHGVVMVRAAKRSGWLEPFDAFFGYQEVVSRLAPQLLRLVRELTQSAAPGDADYCVLYGEIFGGWYPDGALAAKWAGAVKSGRVDAKTGKVLGAACGEGPVQEGVYYTPDREFAVFDLATVSQRDHTLHILPYHQMLSLCAEAGLFVAPVLKVTATYEEAAHYALGANSVVPAALAARSALRILPLPAGTNVAEGIVVRPDSSALSAATKGAALRPLVKHKHASFAEAEAIDVQPPAESPMNLVWRVYGACLTPAREAAVRSKLGPSAPTAEVAEALRDDVLEDFWTVAPPAYQLAVSKLSPEESTALDARLLAAATRLVSTGNP